MFASSNKGSKPNGTAAAGTGYGGGSNDQSLLLKARTAALAASKHEDACTVKYLQSIQDKLRTSPAVTNRSNDTVGAHSVFDEEKIADKVVDTLRDIFRSQVPTDWDARRSVYEVALAVCGVMTLDSRNATLFLKRSSSTNSSDTKDESSSSDQEDCTTEPVDDSVFAYLKSFEKDARQILRHSDGTNTKLTTDIRVANQVVETYDKIWRLVSMHQCAFGNTTAVRDLTIVSQHEYYKKQLGPLSFDLVPDLYGVSEDKLMARLPTVM